jgi:thioredoxin 1
VDCNDGSGYAQGFFVGGLGRRVFPSLPGIASFGRLSDSIRSERGLKMAGANTLNFTDAGWDTEVLKSEQPVLVDFWATWCGPCRQMTPIIDQLAEEYNGKAKIGKLNVDEHGQTAMRYQVRGIPTILLFKGGQLVASQVGSVGKEKLKQMINEHV